jgi:hypothetical protein
MLLFQEKPDKIFTQILHEALDIAIDIVKFPDEDKDGEYYRLFFPNASKNFSRDMAFYVLEELKEYCADPNLWKMTDYHLVLLYDALKHYCDVAGDCAKDSGETMLSIGDYKVWEVNFDDMIACYFRDLDFLHGEELFLDVPEAKKKCFGYRGESFGVAVGMKPHIKELALEFYEQGEFIPENPRPSMYRKESKVYPDVSEAENY